MNSGDKQMASIKEENQTLIEAYLKHKKNQNRSSRDEGIAQGSLNQYRSTLQNFSNNLDKRFVDVTENDVLNHLEHYSKRTRNHIVMTLKSFYRFVLKLDDDDPIPKTCGIKNVQYQKIKLNKVKYQEKIIPDQTYELLLLNCKTPMHRALLEGLRYSGSRKIGIQNMLVGDVTYDGEFTRVIIREDKTEPRTVSIAGRLEYLLAWKESLCPVRNNPKAPLFVTHKLTEQEQTRRCYKKKSTREHVQYLGIDGRHYEMIKKDFTYNLLLGMCNTLGLKRIRPHDFRHTLIRELRKKGVPDTHIETTVGWVHGSGMLKIYDWNSTQDYEDWLKQDKQTVIEPTYEIMQKKVQEDHFQEKELLKQQNEELKNKLEDIQNHIADQVKAEMDKQLFTYWSQHNVDALAKKPQAPNIKKQN